MEIVIHHLRHPFTEPVTDERYKKILGEEMSVQDHIIKGIAVTVLVAYVVFATLSMIPIPFVAVAGAVISLPILFYVYHAAAKVFAWKKCEKHAPLLEAAKANNVDEVKKFLEEENSYEINYSNFRGETAAHFAGENQNSALLQELFVKYNADITLTAKVDGESGKAPKYLTPLAFLGSGEAIYRFLKGRETAVKLGKILSERYDLGDKNWEKEYNQSPADTAFLLAAHMNDPVLWSAFNSYWNTTDRVLQEGYPEWKEKIVKSFPLTIKKTLKIEIT